MADAFSDQVSGEADVFTGFPPSGITLCPRCDYELTGLPIVGACPECGLRYDAESQVWEKRRQMGVFPSWPLFKKASFQTAILTIATFMPKFCVDGYVWISGYQTLFQVCSYTLVGLAVVFGLESAFWYFDNRSYRTVLAVMPEVLIQSHWFGGRPEIPMHCVIKAQESSLIDTVKPISVFYRPGKPRGRICIRGVLIPDGVQAEHDVFVKAINRHPKVQRS